MNNNRSIFFNTTILEALKLMDDLDKKLLIVLDGDKFSGLLSAGDIQRAIIKEIPLESAVNQIMRKNIRVASPDDDFSIIKQMMFDYRMELCPVIDNESNIVNVYFWEEVFQELKPHPKNRFNLPVVIMAGGMGTRMRPLTYVLPKALLPISEKTMMEEIFDRFAVYGCESFYISVNYKADFIINYIENLNLPYKIEYFNEDKPLGTAGSLNLLKGKFDSTFFVSNCDILIDQDYSEILQFHKESQNEITIVAALKHFPVAYGTVETGPNGVLIGLTEKPEFILKINSGMYILEPGILNEVPENSFFHITQLIENVKARGGKVGVFPVSKNSWKDIGELDQYLKLITQHS